MAKPAARKAPPREPAPEEAALRRLADMAARGTTPPKMRSAVISMAMGLRMQHGAIEAQRILQAVHGELVEGVMAAEEAISGLDKDDDKAAAHSQTSLAVLVAARDAVEREVSAPVAA